MLLANIDIVPGNHKEVTATLADDPGQAFAAATTWVAAVAAITTFAITHNLRERQLRQQREAEKSRFRQERSRLTQERRDQRERRNLDKQIAEQQQLEAQFQALAADFAKDDSLSRINAAIGLGEMAIKPDPTRLDANWEVMDDPLLNPPEGWDPAWRSKKTEKNYPYFMRAATRLAAALHQWDGDAELEECKRVTFVLGSWAKNGGTDEPLLVALANAVADANRATFQMVAQKIAECIEQGIDADTIDSALTNQDAFYVRRADVVRDLVGHRDLKAAPEGSPLSHREVDAIVRPLNRLRDELARTLLLLSAPPDGHVRKLSLRQTFLVTANLRGAHLDGVDLRQSFLQGVRLHGARLEGADLYGSQLREALLPRAELAYAKLWYANCIGAVFSGCKLVGTKLANAKLGQVGDPPADLDDANWWEADFAEPRFSSEGSTWEAAASKDEELYNWLDQRYPERPEKNEDKPAD